jgi:type IV secretory pathway TrbD component
MAESTGETKGIAAGRAHQRRVYLVDRAFQLKYTALLMGTGLLVALVFGLWIWQAHQQTTELVSVDPALRPVLEASDRQLLYVFVGIATLLAAALGLLGLVVTHRVAGPMFVMGHYMSVLAQGRFPRMRTLRRHDELKSFFHVFLQAVQKLKEREADHAAVLEEAVERMRAAGSQASDLAPAIAALEAAALERRRALSADDPELTPMFVPVFRGGKKA